MSGVSEPYSEQLSLSMRGVPNPTQSALSMRGVSRPTHSAKANVGYASRARQLYANDADSGNDGNDSGDDFSLLDLDELNALLKEYPPTEKLNPQNDPPTKTQISTQQQVTVTTSSGPYFTTASSTLDKNNNEWTAEYTLGSDFSSNDSFVSTEGKDQFHCRVSTRTTNDQSISLDTPSVNNNLKDDLMNDLRGEMASMRQQLRKEIKDELREELKDELKQEIKEEWDELVEQMKEKAESAKRVEAGLHDVRDAINTFVKRLETNMSDLQEAMNDLKTSSNHSQNLHSSEVLNLSTKSQNSDSPVFDNTLVNYFMNDPGCDLICVERRGPVESLSHSVAMLDLEGEESPRFQRVLEDQVTESAECSGPTNGDLESFEGLIFDGVTTSWNKFEESFRQKCRNESWSDEKMATMIPTYLSGAALEFYNSLDKEICLDIEHVLAGLCYGFDTGGESLTSGVPLTQIFQHQDESMFDFYSRVYDLALNAPANVKFH